MHREISHTDSALEQESNLSLYLMTALLGALMALDLLPRLGTWAGWPALTLLPAELAGYRFAFIAAILGGARVVYSSLQSLLDGRIGADLALAIAAIAAILINEPLVAAEVVFIGMVGECLEAFTFARTRNAIRKIVEVFPRRCWLLRDGQEVRVFTSELQVGDRVVVKPGAKIPADGVVLDGRSAVDTSALTGESVPLDKGPGDEVLAGSVNQFGALTLEARRVAEQTVAGRVIELTGRALKNKANIERTADRLARYFLPVVLALAVLTFLAYLAYFGGGWFRSATAPRLGLRQAITYSLYPTLAVLVVACPCALILATPAAIIAALGRLAGTGVLIKGGSALERLAAVRAFAFDKTGTITEGRLEIAEVVSLSELAPDDVLRAAAVAEQRSEHPLARVILHEAQRRQLALDAIDDFEALPGAGIRATSAGRSLLVGTRRLLEEAGLVLAKDAQETLARFDAAGQTALLVALENRIVGAIAARDRVRPEAAGVIEVLRTLGIDPIVLLTGDRSAAANSIAADLGFNAIHAELLPEEKAKHLQLLKNESPSSSPLDSRPSPLLIAMVGDGINDAPALAGADVGLALGGTGSDIAAEAGDIVLMGDPLSPLPLLVRLSRETVRIIRQNIFIFAFAVNAIGIVLTSWLWPLLTPEGWYEQSPLAAVVYHQLGSLLVLLNSMRLLWFERTWTNPAWLGFKHSLRDADQWVTRNLDVGEASHWLEHHWRVSTLMALCLLAALYALSGIRVIASDEVAVVRHFGRVVEELPPGWHWRFPWPVDEVTRVSQRLRTVEVGFRESAGKAAPLTWASAHRRDQRNSAEAEEALMITGDGNLVDLMVSVRFKVTEPRVYLFEVKAADDVIRAAAEATLRTMVAGKPFFQLLTVQRREFQEEALRRLKIACARYRSGGLGVEFDSIAILDLHPPADVVEVYYEVAKAMERRDQKVNAALARATKKLKDTDAEQQRIVAQARAARLEQVKAAEAARARFLSQQQARSSLSWSQEGTLGANALRAVIAGESESQVEARWRKERQEQAALNAAFTDFRLYWDSLARALSGREMLLIDADNLTGRRNLMLFDPDLLRMPFPVWLPQGKNATRMPGQDEGP